MDKKKIQNYINHVVFIVDQSGSMSHLSQKVVEVFDGQIKYLSRRSQELNQETRVSVYMFSFRDMIECLIYDMDVMRLPSLAGFYHANGNTALIDAVMKAVYDLGKTPELYGDHAFLIYTVTDGQENNSQTGPEVMVRAINALPENWTLAVLVPDQVGVFDAKKFGFPAENISVWDSTSVKGLEEAGGTIRESTESFFTMRSQGIRGTKSLFRPEIKATPTQVKKALEEIPPSQYTTYRVPTFRNPKDYEIRNAVEKLTRSAYVKGTAFYQLVERTKPHKVQDYKLIIIRDNISGKSYTGDNARVILGLPDQGEVKVKPGDFKNFDVFVQSTSYNRHLPPGTDLIIVR